MPSILLINGPNLNLLGTREPSIYGSQTLADIETLCKSTVTSHKSPTNSNLTFTFSSYQSNHEGQLVERIHQAKQQENITFIVINAAAYTHTSVAIRDAFAATQIPFVEVHITNVYKREAFRHNSYLSDKAEGVVCGLGGFGYVAACEFAMRQVEQQIEKERTKKEGIEKGEGGEVANSH